MTTARSTGFARILIAALLAACPAAFAADPVETVFGAVERDPAVTPPAELLGHPLAARTASPEQIDAMVRTWAEQSPRLALLPYGETHQGRPLRMLAVSTPDNLARLDAIRADLAVLADPRGADRARADAIVADSPAVGVLAYSIHGNETSGADAALGLLYHLASSRDPALDRLLSGVVLLVDPMMNPDGRARAVADLRGFAGATPVHDDQALGRFASWPYGRGNHYVFDLNRDWLVASQPETRGRIRLLRDFHPVFFVDAHEMGAQDTFLFSPPRKPLNPFLSGRFGELVKRFSTDMAGAFDRRGWLYYNGEWNEGWFPGYSDSWAALRGAAGMLYEQARVADDGVLQANRRVLGYDEAVSRQLGASWANIETLAALRGELLAALRDDRRAALDGPSVFHVVPGDQPAARLAALEDVLAINGVEYRRSDRPVRVPAGRDAFGRERAAAEYPAGTLVVAARQPLARWVANLFETDLRIDEASIARERESLLRGEGTTVYDITAWSLPLLFGLDALRVEGRSPLDGALASGPAPRGVPAPAPGAVGYVIDGRDDASQAAAASLLRAGLRPRLATEGLQLGGQRFAPGSLVVTRFDHRDLDPAVLQAALEEAGRHLRTPIRAIDTGLGAGDLPDLGGGKLRLLEPPRVAILGHGSTDSNAFGFVWHLLDQRLGLAPVLLNEGWLGQLDLRRYNVIVLPERWGPLPAGLADALKPWVESGGTLVAMGNAASGLAGKDGLAAARTLSAAIEDLAPYRERLGREWRVALGDAGGDWSRTATAGSPAAWPKIEHDKLDKDALAAQDAWRRTFMPQGALVAARCDGKHWLALGCDGALPVLVDGSEPLMAAGAVDAPIRYGVIEPSGDSEARAFGWSGLPEGHTLRLRLGGLLWPEAQERLANAAWLTREAKGSGQLVLFASAPAFRAATHGMQRLLGNAVVYGPGLGTSPVITAP